MTSDEALHNYPELLYHATASAGYELSRNAEDWGTTMTFGPGEAIRIRRKPMNKLTINGVTFDFKFHFKPNAPVRYLAEAMQITGSGQTLSEAVEDAVRQYFEKNQSGELPLAICLQELPEDHVAWRSLHNSYDTVMGTLNGRMRHEDVVLCLRKLQKQLYPVRNGHIILR